MVLTINLEFGHIARKPLITALAKPLSKMRPVNALTVLTLIMFSRPHITLNVIKHVRHGLQTHRELILHVVQ